MINQPALFNSNFFIQNQYDELNKYFENNLEHDLASVSENFFLSNGWKVCWLITTSPFRIILEIFFSCIASLLDCCGAEKLAIRCFVLSKHFNLDLRAIGNYFQYGDHLLVPTKNHHRIDPPIYLLNEQDDPQAAQRKLKFYQDASCRGGNLWFAQLLSQKYELPLDIKNLFCSVAQIFADGIPEAAAVLQSMADQNAKNCFPHSWQESSSIPISSYVCSSLAFSSAIRDLPSDLHAIKIYYTPIKGHEVLLLKNPDGGLYLLDLNVGLLHWEADDAADQIYEYLKRYLPKIDRGNLPENAIRFISIKPR